MDKKIEILGFGIYTPATPFEPILILSLLILVWLSWQQSERFIRWTLLVASIALSVFALKVWFADFKHFAVLYGLFALIGIFFSVTRFLPVSKLKYVFASWFVLLAFGLWFFEILKFIPFHRMHYINQPFRLYFSGYIAWGIFLALSGAAIFFLKNKKRVLASWIGVLFLFVVLLEGKPSTLGLTKYNNVLFWGTGVDRANAYGETELYVAVEKQDIERVKELLAAGTDVNEPRTKVIGGASTPFEKAILSNNYELFLLLAEKGGNITNPNKDGNMPIHIASFPTVKEFRIIKYLLDHGADINARDKMDMQPIHRAVDKGYDFKAKQNVYNPDLVKFLIENGADIEAQAKHFSAERKSTPLVFAAARANFEAVKILVELGANLNAEDPYGRNALEFAKYNKKALKNNPNSAETIEGYDKIIEYLTPLMENKD